MDDQEWRNLGVKQSAGWIHYLIHAPEPHILLFRREKDYQLKYPNGAAPPAQQSSNAHKLGGMAG